MKELVGKAEMAKMLLLFFLRKVGKEHIDDEMMLYCDNFNLLKAITIF